MNPLATARKIYRRLRPAQDHWTHFLSILDRRTLEHDAALDAAAKRALFKRNVDLVELEPHAYCNRTCSFCPNATIDRLTVKTHLDHGLYESVLDELASIGYDKVLRFARYSEPMAHEHIYEMIALARRRLPRATIDIVTNGDFLNPPALARLREAGLSILRVSVYMRRGVPWSVEAAREEIARLGRRIQLTPTWDPSTATTVAASFPGAGLPIVVFSHNFDETGYDRGQLLEQLTDRDWVRRSPCFLVFSNFTVDFNGTVMPCCNLRSDHPKHAAFAVGDLAKKQSIFDVYAGPEFTAWRRSLAAVGEKADPCRTCRQKALEGPELERLGRAVDAKLSAIGVDVS
jgi:radical SAM protein with 4Fe4S-binding SPASM domain